MKTCVTCKHHRGDDVYMQCAAPQNMKPPPEPSPSTIARQTRLGILVPPPWPEAPEWYLMFCDTHRMRGWFKALLSHTCGKRGRWWERAKMTSMPEE